MAAKVESECKASYLYMKFYLKTAFDCNLLAVT